MATTRHRNGSVPFSIHHDRNATAEEEQEEMEDSKLEDEEDMEDDCSEKSEDSNGVIDPAVLEDIKKLEESFPGLEKRFRLISRIGEG